MLDPFLILGLQIAGIACLSGIVQGAFGFGYAIAALTAIPFLIPPQTAHIVISLSGIPVMAMAAWTSRKGTDWKSTGYALLGGACFLPLGLFTFSNLSADSLIRGTGLAILVLMTWELLKPAGQANQSQGQQQGPGSALIAGAISGYLAGAVSIGGPPIVAYAMKQNWPPLQAKAFMTRCLLFISASKGIGLFAGNFVTSDLGVLALCAAPGAVLGVWFGSWITRSISTVHYRRAVMFILIIISSMWVYRGAPPPTPEQESAIFSQRNQKLTGYEQKWITLEIKNS